VSSYSELRVHFFYYALGVESGETFVLEYSSPGNYWSVAQEFIGGTDFKNNEWLEVVVDFDASSFNDVRLQFRCDGSDNTDKIWIDTVRFEGK
jgi:hypothetical protein